MGIEVTSKVAHEGQAHDSRFANGKSLQGLERFTSNFEWTTAIPDYSTQKIYATIEEPKPFFYRNKLKEFVTSKRPQQNILKSSLAEVKNKIEPWGHRKI